MAAARHAARRAARSGPVVAARADPGQPAALRVGVRVRHRRGSTPWQLAGDLTWSRPWDQYGGQMRIFAVTETAAHAHLLERRGLVTASRDRPPVETA